MAEIIFTVSLLIGLPLIFLLILWRAKFKAKLMWLLDALVTVMIILWLFQFGNWIWLSYYLRYLWILLLIYVLISSYLKVKHLPLIGRLRFSEYATIALYTLLVLIFGAYNFQAFNTYTYDDEQEVLSLESPLKDGTYIVGQGGDGTMMNYHSAYEPQRYALDLLKINKLGMRAKGIYPEDKTKYKIYSVTVYSPCDGVVKASVNDLKDFNPPKSDPDHPEGNHIVLNCEQSEAELYLAHLKKGSVLVGKGENVTKGQPLGEIGNSGNTSEPHLHIHAEKDGQGVPILFNERFLVRNQRIN